jgi:isopenicillin N synthase-like dioxygenase
MTVATFSLPELVDALGRPSGADLLATFDAALTDPGAFCLTDLPVPPELVAAMHDVTNEFFQLPVAVKVGYRYEQDQYVGWCGGEFLGQYGSADHKEMYHIGPRVAPTLVAHTRSGALAILADDLKGAALGSCALWPEAPAEFIAVWHEYYQAMQATAVLIGRVLARLLGITEREWFAVVGGNWADLAANFYPPVTPSDGAAPIYNAPHRDLTIFTVLHQDQSPVGGLSVQAADGSWDAVAPRPDAFVVNVGELLTYLSGDRWRAAPHQVTVTQAATPTAAPRISVPFFYRPSDDRVVTSFVDLGSAPIAVGDWVLAKKQASRTAQKESA